MNFVVLHPGENVIHKWSTPDKKRAHTSLGAMLPLRHSFAYIFSCSVDTGNGTSQLFRS